MDTSNTVAIFQIKSATAVGVPSPTNPCGSLTTDVETVRFTDDAGHSSFIYISYRYIAGAGLPNTIQAIASQGPSVPMSLNVANPTIVTGPFTATLQEKLFLGPFTATIDSYDPLLTESCYTVGVDSSGVRAIFTPRQAPAIGASPTATSPCAYLNTDVEGALFEDGVGNALQVYFENHPVAASGTIQASLSTSNGVVPISATASNLSTPASFPTAGFAIKLSESNYSGMFSATVDYHGTPLTSPCYTVSMDPTGTIAIFTQTSPPCVDPGIAPEGIAFTDSVGNVDQIYFTVGASPTPPQATLVGPNGMPVGPVITSSQTAPYAAPYDTFEVALTEPNYSGKFAATMIYFGLGILSPCYSASMDTSGTIAIFTPTLTAPMSAPYCTSTETSTEGALLEDQFGNASILYFAP